MVSKIGTVKKPFLSMILGLYITPAKARENAGVARSEPYM